jgi:F-type H+-transporting ATPase subunit epsilon
MALTLHLITPTRQLVEAEVEQVIAPGAAGQFGVLPEHVTFLGELDLGLLTYVEHGTTKRVVVHGGYAEVVDDVVTILADEAELPEEIDATTVREELADVERQLATIVGEPAEVDALLRERRRAHVRLAAAG